MGNGGEAMLCRLIGPLNNHDILRFLSQKQTPTASIPAPKRSRVLGSGTATGAGARGGAGAGAAPEVPAV
jgi:hypothetical protein